MPNFLKRVLPSEIGLNDIVGTKTKKTIIVTHVQNLTKLVLINYK